MYQEQIIKILENHLEVAKISPYDCLYTTLGMDSLDVMWVAGDIEVAFGLAPDSVANYMAERFTTMTVADLIEFVKLEKNPLKQTAPKHKAPKSKAQKKATGLTTGGLKKLFADMEKMR